MKVTRRQIKMRINKFLAHCGIDSRRKCESYILDSRVTVNGKVINDLSFIVNENDIVEVDDNRVSIPNNYEYHILHKPKGYICMLPQHNYWQKIRIFTVHILYITSPEFSPVQEF